MPCSEFPGDLSAFQREVGSATGAAAVKAAKGMAVGAFCIVFSACRGRHRSGGRHEHAGRVDHKPEIAFNRIGRSTYRVLVLNHYGEVTGNHVPGFRTVRCELDGPRDRVKQGTSMAVEEEYTDLRVSYADCVGTGAAYRCGFRMSIRKTVVKLGSVILLAIAALSTKRPLLLVADMKVAFCSP